MRPIILTLIAAIIVNSAVAKNWEFGLNGGLALNSAPVDHYKDYYFYPYNNHKSPSDATPAYSLSIAYNMHQWQIGVSLSEQNISYTESGYMFLPFDNVKPYYGSIKYVMADPAIPANIFINRKVNYRKLCLYGGIYGGYAIAFNSGVVNKSWFYRPEVRSDNTAYDFGIQIGGSYFLTKHFGLNAQLNVGQMRLVVSDFGTIFNTFTGTLGLRYKQ
jgi:hypothetical protein